MLEHVRLFGPCCLKKKDHAFSILLLCVLLCGPSPTFASSGFGRRDGFLSLISNGDEKISAPLSGDVTDDENGLCHRIEGSPGRFPYLCSLRLAGSRNHECTATLVNKRWVLTAAHCVDPNHEGSVGCYPTVYCGIYHINTTSSKKRFHVKDAYIHSGWTGNVKRGSDLAMLKLDKAAHLETPRLFRRGMVYGEKDMLMPGWEIGGGRSDICGTQSYLSLYPAWKGRCRSQSGDVPRDGWLCFCGKDENDKTGLDGGPVVVADGPCDVGKGYPGEDLLVGVTSYDPYLPYYRDCNVLTSISYYRDWILETMAGKTPPSECKIKEKPSPLPSDPFLCEKCKKCPKKEEPPATPPPVETPLPEPPIVSKTPPLPVETPSPEPPIESEIPLLPVETPSPEPPIESETPLLPVETPSPEPPIESETPPLPVETPSPEPTPSLGSTDGRYIAIIAAIKDDKSATVDELLQNKLHPDTFLNKAELTTGGLADKSTLMFWATVHEATKSIGVLANGGADVNRVDAEGRTSVYVSAMKNITSSLTALIDVNADLNIPANNGKTALHEAVMGKFVGITKTLVENKADINAPGAGKTPLQLACETDQTVIAEYLVEEGADVTVPGEGKSLFYDAVLKGSKGLVVKMIERGVDLNEIVDGRTALFAAVETGYTEIATELIAAKADVNIPSETGWTVLHTAVEKKYPDITKLLILNGVEVNTIVDDKTPLLIAVQQNNLEIVKMLIQAKADANLGKNDKQQPPLHIAVENGYVEMAKALVSSNINMDTAVDSKTALFIATELGKTEIVSILIAAHANVDTFDADHKSAIHVAVENNNLEIVKAFIDAGADVNIADRTADTALHAAVKYEYTEIVKVLVNKGADTSALNRRGMNVLHVAVKDDSSAIVKFLLQNGADPTKPTQTGDTALHIATRNNNVDIVELLLDNGAQIDQPDGAGETALYEAIDQISRKALKFLLKRGANVEYRLAPHDTTPLMYATTRGNEDIIETLLDSGAIVDAKDNGGSTAMHYGASFGKIESVEALVYTSMGTKLKTIENDDGKKPYDVICTHVDVCTEQTKTELQDLLKP